MLEKLFGATVRYRRIAAGAVVAIGLAAAAGAALAGSGGVYFPQLGITVPDEKVEAVRHSLPPGGPESTERAPVPAGKPDRIPAHMLPADVPVPVSPDLIRPTTAWLVGDGANLVAVYAGAAGDDSSVGRFVIVRQNLVAGRQTLATVDAGATGAVSITSAPAGEAVETSAQRADLAFRGTNGRKGLLHLARDTVTLGP
jgi:hypothetical protein